jgi:hypothetical protein
MPVRCVEYKGMTIKAGAFELNGGGRYVSVLSIGRSGDGDGQRAVKLFDPPCPDDLFGDVDEALESAIAHGQAIIDGNVAGAYMDNS